MGVAYPNYAAYSSYKQLCCDPIGLITCVVGRRLYFCFSQQTLATELNFLGLPPWLGQSSHTLHGNRSRRDCGFAHLDHSSETRLAAPPSFSTWGESKRERKSSQYVIFITYLHKKQLLKLNQEFSQDNRFINKGQGQGTGAKMSVPRPAPFTLLPKDPPQAFLISIQLTGSFSALSPKIL